MANDTKTDELVYKLEVDLNKNSAKNLKNIDNLASSKKFSQQQMQIIKGVSTEISLQVTEDITEETLKKMNIEDAEMAKAQGVNVSLEDSAVNKLIAESVKNSLKIYNDMFNSMYKSTVKNYEKYSKILITDVILGELAPETALYNTCRMLESEGVTGFTTKSGAVYKPATYSKMVMRSGINSLGHNATMARQKENNNDVIEISSHGGAREKCSYDQGELYDIRGNGRYVTDGAGQKHYAKAFGVTSYGLPDGLFGVNCTHTSHGFYSGYSTRGKQKPSQTKNDKMYKATKQQRYNERQIRKYKERSKYEKSAGLDNTKSNQMSKKWSKTNKAHTEKYGLSRNYSREKVY